MLRCFDFLTKMKIMTKITRNRVKIIKAFSAAPELQAAVRDSFSKADQEQEFFKALQIIGLEIEKAHIVGDVFFQGGKQYVWKEYAPGKFDWRIANKTTGVIKGKGINGILPIIVMGCEINNKVFCCCLLGCSCFFGGFVCDNT